MAQGRSSYVSTSIIDQFLIGITGRMASNDALFLKLKKKKPEDSTTWNTNSEYGHVEFFTDKWALKI